MIGPIQPGIKGTYLDCQLHDDGFSKRQQDFPLNVVSRVPPLPFRWTDVPERVVSVPAFSDHADMVIVIFFQLETFGLGDFWNKGVQVGINGAHKDLSLSAKQAPCPGDCFRHRFGAVSHSCGEKRGIGGERKSSRVGGNLVGMEEI